MSDWRFIVVASGLAAFGCSDRGTNDGVFDERGCGTGPAPAVELRGVALADGTVRLEGSVELEVPTAIRSLTLEGEDATLGAFNFRRFSVTLPREAVPTLGDVEDCPLVDAADADSTICVAVRIETACGPVIERDVGALVLRTMVSFSRAGLPIDGDRVLPANGSVPIDVTITSSVPGTATLEPAPGSDGAARFGTTAGSSELRLSTTAPVTSRIVAIRAGVVRLRVTTSDDPEQTFDLIVARPPVLTPGSGTIDATLETAVLVSADAPLVDCVPTNAILTLDGASPPPDGLAGRQIAALGLTPTAGATEVRLTCTDELEQSSTAIYVVGP